LAEEAVFAVVFVFFLNFRSRGNFFNDGDASPLLGAAQDPGSVAKSGDFSRAHGLEQLHPVGS
jgi:hypothetical protein